VSLLHHAHHFEPFDWDAGFPDPLGDRRALKIEVGQLRRQVIEKDRVIAHLRSEIARIEARGKKRWRR